MIKYNRSTKSFSRELKDYYVVGKGIKTIEIPGVHKDTIQATSTNDAKRIFREKYRNTSYVQAWSSDYEASADKKYNELLEEARNTIDLDNLIK